MKTCVWALEHFILVLTVELLIALLTPVQCPGEIYDDHHQHRADIKYMWAAEDRRIAAGVRTVTTTHD